MVARRRPIDGAFRFLIDGAFGFLIVLPVPGSGFRGQFWAGFGRKPSGERTKNRSRAARAEGPGSLGQDLVCVCVCEEHFEVGELC